MTTNPQSERPVNFMLLGASFGTHNRGVSALASGTINSAVSAFPNARVQLLDYGREPARYTVPGPNGPVEVELVNIRFSKKFYLRNNIAWLLLMSVLAWLVPHRGWRRAWLAKNPHLKKILDADVI